MTWRPTVQKQLTQAEAHQLTRQLADAVLLLGAAMVDMPRLVPALNDAANGISSSFGGGGVAGGDVSDPTFSAVYARIQGRTDTAAQHMDQVSTSVREVWRLADLLHRIIRGQLVDPTPLPPKCQNVHGCPADHPPRSKAGGRCEACQRFYDRNGEDRDRVHRQTSQDNQQEAAA